MPSKPKRETLLSTTQISYTMKTAVAATGLSETFLRKQVNAGRLKMKQVDGRPLIMAEDLRAFLATAELTESSKRGLAKRERELETA